MFALFYSLYYSMFIGQWTPTTISDLSRIWPPILNSVGKLATSIFGDASYDNFGNDMYGNFSNPYSLLALVLATITSIGIVVMAVKGVKKAFGIFFMGIRR